MHPILARPGRLAAYLAMWAPPGLLLAALLALEGVFSWRVAAATAIPLSIAYGFLCLSAWYVAAGAPIDRAGPLRIATTASVAAFLSSAVCLLLADFLRDTLALGARDWIPLSSELAIAKRFLAIEQVRFGDRLRIEVTADAAEECLVPPLVLQPLVENAVTHGIAHVLEGGVVRIAAERGIAVLRIRVDNPCDRDRPAGRGPGVGLANVRARLRTLYGNDAALRTEEKEGRFTANIELP